MRKLCPNLENDSEMFQDAISSNDGALSLKLLTEVVHDAANCMKAQ